jgi:nucleotide-binding universal stress UspA family protein
MSENKLIIVGVDGSKQSNAAAQWAARQAELTGSSLELVTTWEWPSSYGWVPPLPDDYDPVAPSQSILDTVVSSLREGHPELVITTRVIEGHPAPVLVDQSKNADLLVVGSRGHGEFAGMLIGSVSQHCVANAHCPVLVLRQD